MHSPWNDDDDSAPSDDGCSDDAHPLSNVNGLPMIPDTWVDVTGHAFGDTGGTDLMSFDDDPFGC